MSDISAHRIISDAMLSEYLVADMISPTSTFYVRNVLPFYSQGEIPVDQLSGKNVNAINCIVARAISEKYIPVGHGKVIAFNVPGGRITAAYPLMHQELKTLPSQPPRITMLRHFLMDGSLQEHIYLPHWYKEEFGEISGFDANIERQFSAHCILPWIKKRTGNANHAKAISIVCGQYRFTMRRSLGL